MPNRLIVLVEDNADDEELTLRALKKARVDNPVKVVRDGAEALDFFFCRGAYAERDAHQIILLVMLDLKLPKIDGLEVLRALRADERTKLIPIVVLTSSNEEQDLMRSYNLGANSYVCKPVDFVQFADAVGQLGLYWLLINQPHPSNKPRAMAEMTFTRTQTYAPDEMKKLVVQLTRLGARELEAGSEAAAGASLHLIPAQTVAMATPLIDKLGFDARKRTILIGIEGVLDTRYTPKPGSLGAMLELHRPLGVLAIRSILAWRSAKPGFMGAKRYADRLGCQFSTAQQTATYAAWLNAPGKSAAEFLSELVGVYG